MIVVDRLSKDYGRGEATLRVLDDVSFSVPPGEFTAITGPSGSGKSTLLGLLAGLDRPSEGTIEVDGVDLTALDEEGLSRLRGRKIGFVFQSFQLLQTLTALENVRVPAEILGDDAAAARAVGLLERVGLGNRAGHYPSQLSGGEMQRTAIARAAVTHPPVILADEPTGNLDSDNGSTVMELLLELNASATLVLVTHNPELAAMADREIRLRDGRIAEIVEHGRRGLAGQKRRAASATGTSRAKRKASGGSRRAPPKGSAPKRKTAPSRGSRTKAPRKASAKKVKR